MPVGDSEGVVVAQDIAVGDSGIGIQYDTVQRTSAPVLSCAHHEMVCAIRSQGATDNLAVIQQVEVPSRKL